MQGEIKFFNPVDETLYQQRIVLLSGLVNSQLAYRVNREILALEHVNPEKEIFLFIDSPGGEINSGFGIYDMIRFVKAPVYTVVAGLAASMGSLIALAAPKNRRLALPNAKFLIHQPLISGVLQGQASDLEIHAKDIVKTKKKINQIYSQEMGRPVSEVEKLTDRDHWLSAEEAQELGLISRIIQSRTDLAL